MQYRIYMLSPNRPNKFEFKAFWRLFGGNSTAGIQTHDHQIDSHELMHLSQPLKCDVGTLIFSDERTVIMDSTLYLTKVSKEDDLKQIKCVTLNRMQRTLTKSSRKATLHVISKCKLSTYMYVHTWHIYTYKCLLFNDFCILLYY